MSDMLIKFVSGKNNEPMVSSREVAAKFGKEHRRVLQSLREQVIPLVSEPFGLHNFVQSTYQADNGKLEPEILLTKDGFLILAMGFTGSEAMQWKELFIDAFNAAIGSVVELKIELARKEQVILKLQGKKKKREHRWLVPSYDEPCLPGFSSEPRMVLKPQAEIKQPDLNIAKLNHLEKTMVGLEKQMAALKREIGYLARG
jgi:Rha family phage regulatory protein